MKKRIAMLAAVLAAAAFSASAAELRADQKLLVEKMLAQMEPSMREPFRGQIEQSVLMLNEEQVKAMLASIAEDAAAAGETYEEEPEPAALSPEDYAYNRKQFEPAIRKNWTAQKAFDDYVDAELAARCPGRDQYAVYGSAYRYELRALSPQWPRASVSADTDVTVLAGSYAPQDGRYDFDFSKVRDSFDKAAVGKAVAKACGDWTKEAAAFQAKARALADRNDFEGAFVLEQASSAKVEPIEAALDAVIKAQAPSADYALYTALQNGRRVK